MYNLALSNNDFSDTLTDLEQQINKISESRAGVGNCFSPMLHISN